MNGLQKATLKAKYENLRAAYAELTTYAYNELNLDLDCIDAILDMEETLISAGALDEDYIYEG